MKPEYVNSLKAGIKTAVITFVTSLIATAARLMDAVRSWTVDGNPPNMDVFQATAWAAVLALIIGVGNTAMRFLQAAGVPFVGAMFDKMIGVLPHYPPPPEAPVDQIGPDDRGESTVMIVVGVLAAVALVIWIVKATR